MPNLSEAGRAMCPFYRTCRNTEIQCESHVRGTRCIHVFRSRDAMFRFKRRYCDTFEWDSCGYAVLICQEESRES